MPAVIALLPVDAKLPAGWAHPDFLLAGAPYVEGSVAVPGGTVLVRFNYDPAAGTVDLKKAAEWMGASRPAAMDYYSGREVPHGGAPIFHVGSLYLRVTAIDLKARSFTLQSVPASEYTRFDLARGAVLPDFSWTSFDGKTHKFSELTGQYRLLDFWATWCMPCVMDLSSKKAVYAKYHARGLEILGIDGDADKPDAAQQMIARQGLAWPQARFDKELVEKRFAVNSWPALILVDRSGRIVSSSIGELYGDALDKTLAKLLPAN